jgi:hypothetical protein
MAGRGGQFSAGIGSGQAIGAAVTTVLQMSIEEFDISNWYDPTTYRYTPQRPGVYRLSGQFRAGANPGTAWLGLNKSGSLFKWAGPMLLSGAHGFAASWLVRMNGTTDYLELVVQFQNAVSLSNDPTTNYFQGEAVGI